MAISLGIYPIFRQTYTLVPDKSVESVTEVSFTQYTLIHLDPNYVPSGKIKHGFKDNQPVWHDFSTERNLHCGDVQVLRLMKPERTLNPALLGI